MTITESEKIARKFNQGKSAQYRIDGHFVRGLGKEYIESHPVHFAVMGLILKAKRRAALKK